MTPGDAMEQKHLLVLEKYVAMPIRLKFYENLGSSVPVRLAEKSRLKTVETGARPKPRP